MRPILGAALSAIDAGDRDGARAAAAELGASDDAHARSIAARLQYLLRDYATALATLDERSEPLARLRYSFLKRLRFEEEAGACLEALLARPDARVLEAAVLHFEAADRPDLALARLEELGARTGDPARWQWLRARLAARLGDRATVEDAARRAPALDADARAELVDALRDVGAFDAAAALGDDAVRAELALFRGAPADDVLARADRAGAVEVAIAALLHAGRLAEARARSEAWTGDAGPTLAVLRAEIAWRGGDVEEATRWLARARDAVPDYLAAELLWVLVDGARRPDARLGRFAYEGLLEGKLAALGVAPPLDAHGEVERAALDRAAREALAILGPNRTPRPTRTIDGELGAIAVPASPRHRARRAQHRAVFVGIDAAAREVDAVLAELGPHPVAACYRAELELWAGRYALAEDAFRAIVAERRGTVWGWIGLASARLRLGDAARALATLDEGVAAIGFRGATVPVTRGEALLAVGRLDEAERELRAACRAHPGRISAWALRVLCADARGDAEARDRAFARLDRDAPALCADAARAAGVPGWWPGAPSPAQRVETARAALALMRGNRSSSCALWLAPETARVRAHVPDRPATTAAWERDEVAALARLARAEDAGARPSR